MNEPVDRRSAVFLAAAAPQFGWSITTMRDEENRAISLALRSVEPSKNDPLSFTAYGVKEIHRVSNHHETSSKLVVKYHIRLITERRTEENPSGLLIAEYGEELIEGEKQDATAQGAGFGPSH